MTVFTVGGTGLIDMPGMKWALLGASDVAATRVLPAMRRLGHQAVSVYSSALLHAQQYAEREQVPRAVDSVERAFEGADAVYISTQNPVHAEHARAALEAGLDVLCEKPMALELEEAVELILLAEDRGLVLAVNHHLPASPVVQRLAGLVHDGAVGEPLGLRVNHAVLLPERLRTWRIQDLPGAGVVFDVTVHDAAVIDLLIGRAPTRAAALAVHQGPWAKGAVDAVMSTLTWGDEVLCQTYDAFTVGFGATSIEVHGTHGSLVATDVMTQEPVGELVLRGSGGIRALDIGPRTDLYETALDRFEMARTEHQAPLVTGLQGTQAVATAMAVAEAAERAVAVPVTDATARLVAARAARPAAGPVAPEGVV